MFRLQQLNKESILCESITDYLENGMEIKADVKNTLETWRRQVLILSENSVVLNTGHLLKVQIYIYLHYMSLRWNTEKLRSKVQREMWKVLFFLALFLAFAYWFSYVVQYVWMAVLMRLMNLVFRLLRMCAIFVATCSLMVFLYFVFR